MRFSALAGSVLVLAFGCLTAGVVTVMAQEASITDLAPAQAHTIALSRCGSAGLTTPGANCRGFDAREVRDKPDIFVVGFENNQEINEKHVLQVVTVFDLSQVAVAPDSEVSHATLGYAEGSTTRRSAAGESEYGILPTCNTTLGVPTTEWNGSTDAIVATRPALTAGVTPATTGSAGAWDVTPQIQAWLAAGQQQGTLVLGADDQSPDIREQTMCLSYVFDLGLHVEVTPKS
jgi:hypothetical protein